MSEGAQKCGYVFGNRGCSNTRDPNSDIFFTISVKYQTDLI